MTCHKCSHVFEAEIVVNAPIDVAVASMRAVSCPECGAREVGLGGAYSDTPHITAPIEHRVNWWQTRGERGISSDTIAAVMRGTHYTGSFGPDVPHDPGDFRRCKLLFDIVPEWRGRLNEVTERYPWFAPFEEAWPEFERLYEEEVSSGSAPKLYRLMQEVENKSRAIRYPDRKAGE